MKSQSRDDLDAQLVQDIGYLRVVFQMTLGLAGGLAVGLSFINLVHMTI